MPSRKILLPLAVVAGLALFFYALVHILLLRYERGDLYPTYSTLRSDPLGARAFYESLQETGNYRTSRGFVSLHRELEEKPDALYFLGFSAYELSDFGKDEIKALDDYVQNGGRVVIALDPLDVPESDSEEATKKKDKDKKTKDKKAAAKNPPAPAPPPEKEAPPKTEQEKYERDAFKKENEDEKLLPGEFPPKFEPTIQAVWGFGWELHKSTDKPDKSAAATEYSKKGDVLAVGTDPAKLEAKVPWKSGAYFVRIEPAWQILYKAKSKPVLIERRWGKGDILISTDTYFLSNEALRDDRQPFLLSLVAGRHGALLFDEVHLGTEEKDGVMVLAQRFRLEGYLYGMLVVAALFLWRNSVPLVPPRTAQTVLGGTVSGKDSRSGLVNLLRRNIGERDILQTCLVEWRRTVNSGRNRLDPKTTEMESILASTDSKQPAQIVQAYHQLREINTGSRTPESHATKS